MLEKQNLALPIAIVIAGALIGGSLFFVGRTNAPATDTTPAVAQKDIPGVTSADHSMGSIDAPIVIVEYTDLECPFCKQFDGTMKQVVANYGGKVAWVTRNFPLQQLHPNAPKLALGAECVASLGGNDAYWKFLDSIFLQAPINTFFDMTKLTSTAEGVGVNGKEFNTCVASGTFQEKITNEFNDAVGAGGQGTPFSVIVLKDGMSNSTKKALGDLQATLQPGTLLVSKGGKQIGMGGSQPMEIIRSVLDVLLAGK
ncbi:MAG: thioredoxin domain-containing protein [Patescibacteria group bacterium]